MSSSDDKASRCSKILKKILTEKEECVKKKYITEFLETSTSTKFTSIISTYVNSLKSSPNYVKRWKLLYMIHNGINYGLKEVFSEALVANVLDSTRPLPTDDGFANCCSKYGDYMMTKLKTLNKVSEMTKNCVVSEHTINSIIGSDFEAKMQKIQACHGLLDQSLIFTEFLLSSTKKQKKDSEIPSSQVKLMVAIEIIMESINLVQILYKVLQSIPSKDIKDEATMDNFALSLNRSKKIFEHAKEWTFITEAVQFPSFNNIDLFVKTKKSSDSSQRDLRSNDANPLKRQMSSVESSNHNEKVNAIKSQPLNATRSVMNNPEMNLSSQGSSKLDSKDLESQLIQSNRIIRKLEYEKQDYMNKIRELSNQLKEKNDIIARTQEEQQRNVTKLNLLRLQQSSDITGSSSMKKRIEELNGIIHNMTKENVVRKLQLTQALVSVERLKLAEKRCIDLEDLYKKQQVLTQEKIDICENLKADIENRKIDYAKCDGEKVAALDELEKTKQLLIQSHEKCEKIKSDHLKEIKKFEDLMDAQKKEAELILQQHIHDSNEKCQKIRNEGLKIKEELEKAMEDQKREAESILQQHIHDSNEKCQKIKNEGLKVKEELEKAMEDQKREAESILQQHIHESNEKCQKIRNEGLKVKEELEKAMEDQKKKAESILQQHIHDSNEKCQKIRNEGLKVKEELEKAMEAQKKEAESILQQHIHDSNEKCQKIKNEGLKVKEELEKAMEDQKQEAASILKQHIDEANERYRKIEMEGLKKKEELENALDAQKKEAASILKQHIDQANERCRNIEMEGLKKTEELKKEMEDQKKKAESILQQHIQDSNEKCQKIKNEGLKVKEELEKAKEDQQQEAASILKQHIDQANERCRNVEIEGLKKKEELEKALEAQKNEAATLLDKHIRESEEAYKKLENEDLKKILDLKNTIDAQEKDAASNLAKEKQKFMNELDISKQSFIHSVTKSCSEIIESCIEGNDRWNFIENFEFTHLQTHLDATRISLRKFIVGVKNMVGSDQENHQYCSSLIQTITQLYKFIISIKYFQESEHDEFFLQRGMFYNEIKTMLANPLSAIKSDQMNEEKLESMFASLKAAIHKRSEYLKEQKRIELEKLHPPEEHDSVKIGKYLEEAMDVFKELIEKISKNPNNSNEFQKTVISANRMILEKVQALLEKLIILKNELVENEFQQSEGTDKPNSNSPEIDKKISWMKMLEDVKKLVVCSSMLVDSSIGVLTNNVPLEELYVCAHDIAASSANLNQLWNTKANMESKTYNEMISASNHVKKTMYEAISKLRVAAVDSEIMNDSTRNSIKLTATQTRRLEMDAQIQVLRLETMLEKERNKLFKLRKKHADILQTKDDN